MEDVIVVVWCIWGIVGCIDGNVVDWLDGLFIFCIFVEWILYEILFLMFFWVFEVCRRSGVDEEYGGGGYEWDGGRVWFVSSSW